MNKIELAKPVLICLYGLPGSGKSFVARNLANSIDAAHVSAERIRSELFQEPRYDTQENAIILHLMNYMTEEFLKAGIGVVYDTNALRLAQRRNLRALAQDHKASYLLVWLQIDAETAFARTQKRDRRTNDDRFSQPQTRNSFNAELSAMQNPQDEDYVVVSGKHSSSTQKSAVISKLYQMGIVDSGGVQSGVTKPELVNLIPNPQAGRVDMSRRNITIR